MTGPTERLNRDTQSRPRASAAPVHTYDADAEHYDQARFDGAGGALSAALDDALVAALLGPAEGKILLDVPVGTARSSLALAQAGGTVYGLDLSIEMLLRGQQKVRQSGKPPISLIQADAQRMPFPSESVDGVCCLRLFHLVPPKQRPAFVAEFRRVLKPEGLLLVEFPRRLHAAGLPWLARLVRGTSKWYYLGVRERRCLFKGFHLVRVLGGYLPLMRVLAEHDRDAALKASVLLARSPLRVFSRQAFFLFRRVR